MLESIIDFILYNPVTNFLIDNKLVNNIIFLYYVATSTIMRDWWYDDLNIWIFEDPEFDRFYYYYDWFRLVGFYERVTWFFLLIFFFFFKIFYLFLVFMYYIGIYFVIARYIFKMLYVDLKKYIIKPVRVLIKNRQYNVAVNSNFKLKLKFFLGSVIYVYTLGLYYCCVWLFYSCTIKLYYKIIKMFLRIGFFFYKIYKKLGKKIYPHWDLYINYYYRKVFWGSIKDNYIYPFGRWFFPIIYDYIEDSRESYSEWWRKYKLVIEMSFIVFFTFFIGISTAAYLILFEYSVNIPIGTELNQALYNTFTEKKKMDYMFYLTSDFVFDTIVKMKSIDGKVPNFIPFLLSLDSLELKFVLAYLFDIIFYKTMVMTGFFHFSMCVLPSCIITTILLAYYNFSFPYNNYTKDKMAKFIIYEISYQNPKLISKLKLDPLLTEQLYHFERDPYNSKSRQELLIPIRRTFSGIMTMSFIFFFLLWWETELAHHIWWQDAFTEVFDLPADYWPFFLEAEVYSFINADWEDVYLIFIIAYNTYVWGIIDLDQDENPYYNEFPNVILDPALEKKIQEYKEQQELNYKNQLSGTSSGIVFSRVGEIPEYKKEVHEFNIMSKLDLITFPLYKEIFIQGKDLNHEERKKKQQKLYQINRYTKSIDYIHICTELRKLMQDHGVEENLLKDLNTEEFSTLFEWDYDFLRLAARQFKRDPVNRLKMDFLDRIDPAEVSYEDLLVNNDLMEYLHKIALDQFKESHKIDEKMQQYYEKTKEQILTKYFFNINQAEYPQRREEFLNCLNYLFESEEQKNKNYKNRRTFEKDKDNIFMFMKNKEEALHFISEFEKFKKNINLNISPYLKITNKEYKDLIKETIEEAVHDLYSEKQITEFYKTIISISFKEFYHNKYEMFEEITKVKPVGWLDKIESTNYFSMQQLVDDGFNDKNFRYYEFMLDFERAEYQKYYERVEQRVLGPIRLKFSKLLATVEDEKIKDELKDYIEFVIINDYRHQLKASQAIKFMSEETPNNLFFYLRYLYWKVREIRSGEYWFETWRRMCNTATNGVYVPPIYYRYARDEVFPDVFETSFKDYDDYWHFAYSRIAYKANDSIEEEMFKLKLYDRANYKTASPEVRKKMEEEEDSKAMAKLIEEEAREHNTRVAYENANRTLISQGVEVDLNDPKIPEFLRPGWEERAKERRKNLELELEKRKEDRDPEYKKKKLLREKEIKNLKN